MNHIMNTILFDSINRGSPSSRRSLRPSGEVLIFNLHQVIDSMCLVPLVVSSPNSISPYIQDVCFREKVEFRLE